MRNATNTITHSLILLPDSNRIEFTRHGRKLFERKFAEIGIDIEKVTTVKYFLHVHELSLHHEVLALFRDDARFQIQPLTTRQLPMRRHRRSASLFIEKHRA